MHSFTHNPRRTQHGARTTQSPPRRAMHTRRTHDRTHVHTHALHDWQDCEQRHAAARREYYTPSSQSCKGKRQQWTKLLARLSRNLLCSPSTLILCEYCTALKACNTPSPHPCIILWVCTEQLSRLPRHLLGPIGNALYVCTELLSRLQDSFSPPPATLFC